MMLMPALYGRLPEVKYTSPAYEETLVLASVYEYAHERKSTDLIDMYMSLHWSNYLSVLISTICLLLFWNKFIKLSQKRTRKKFVKARKSGYWLMICAILDQYQFPDISHISNSIISICTSLLFFISIDCFILNMVGTDLVVIEDPDAVTSYSDIIKYDKAKALFFQGMTESVIFKNSDIKSDEYEIYTNYSIIFDRIDSRAFMEFQHGFFNRSIVGIIRDWVPMVIANTVMPSLPNSDMYRVYSSSKVVDKKFLNGIMYRSNMDPRFENLISHG